MPSKEICASSRVFSIMVQWFYVMRKCIIDPRKIAIDVAKFSAFCCHQSIVCKSVVGTYDGRYFSVEKNGFRLQLIREPALLASTSVLPFVNKWRLHGAGPHRVYFGWFHCRMFLQNLPGESEGWRFERAMAWFAIEKGKFFESVKHKLLYIFSLQVGISGSSVGSSYTTVVALGCSTSMGSSTSENCFGFCNFSDEIFSLHLRREYALSRMTLTKYQDHCMNPVWYTLPHSFKESSQ